LIFLVMPLVRVDETRPCAQGFGEYFSSTSGSDNSQLSTARKPFKMTKISAKNTATATVRKSKTATINSQPPKPPQAVLDGFSATAAQVIEYLAQHAGELSVATLERRLISLHKAHLESSLKSPTVHITVKRTMQGIRRTFGTKQKQARPMVKDDLLEATVMIDRQKPIKAARDRALLLVGFASAMRRSELVAVMGRCPVRS
jgi:site-specific recombinase XerD